MIKIGEKSYSKEELDHLVTLTQAGHQEAREEIFLFLRARFLSLAKLRLQEEEDAQDIVQETLMIVEDQFSELNGAGSLLAFTDEVMRNKIGNFYRKRDRRQQYHTRWERALDLVYYMDEEFDAADLDRTIWKAINQLGEKRPRCRDLFLGLCEGLSIVELSHRVQLSRPQVDDWLFRCRKALRKILSKNYNLRV